jgi:hypothetical protein
MVNTINQLVRRIKENENEKGDEMKRNEINEFKNG